MKPRGWTLIELMVTVALLGILVLVGADAVASQRASAIDLVLRERARQVLELEAGARVAGALPDPTAKKQLLSELPDAHFSVVEDAASVVRLSVDWRKANGGRGTLSLVLLQPGSEP